MISRAIDAAFGSQRLSYRRLLCWLTCTAMVPFGVITGEDYILICTVYVGSDAAQKAVSAWKS